MRDIPGALIGSRADDPPHIKACTQTTFECLPPGVRVDDYSGLVRSVPAPPQVNGYPFAALRLAPSPDQAIAGAVIRRALANREPLYSIWGDVRRFIVHQFEPADIRVEDSHDDSVLADGLRGLQRDGENALRMTARTSGGRIPVGPDGLGVEETPNAPASPGWERVHDSFAEAIVAMEVPPEAIDQPAHVDWPLMASAPRLELLGASDILKPKPLEGYRPSLWKVLTVPDVNGESAGGRLIYFFARRAAYDLISVSKERDLSDWLRLTVVLLIFLAGLISLLLLTSTIFSAVT